MDLMVKPTHTYPSGRIIYRRAFPPELRSAGLQREHKVPVRRKTEVGLLARYEAAHAEYTAIVERAQRRTAGNFDELVRKGDWPSSQNIKNWVRTGQRLSADATMQRNSLSVFSMKLGRRLHLA